MVAVLHDSWRRHEIDDAFGGRSRVIFDDDKVLVFAERTLVNAFLMRLEVVDEILRGDCGHGPDHIRARLAFRNPLEGTSGGKQDFRPRAGKYLILIGLSYCQVRDNRQ